MSAPPRIDDPEIALAEYAYLTTTGRVTGNPHTVELWFVADEDSVWFLSESGPDWQRNAEAHDAVRVRIGDWEWEATAHLEPATAMSGAGLAARVAMVRKYQPGYGESLDAWARDATALGARVHGPPRPTPKTPPLDSGR